MYLVRLRAMLRYRRSATTLAMGIFKGLFTTFFKVHPGHCLHVAAGVAATPAG